MVKFHNYVLTIVLLACAVGCGDSQMVDNSTGADLVTQNPEATNDTPTESTLLKQEMIDAII